VFFTDDFYGHRRILADHLGLARPRPILAHLQHGWNSREGFGRRSLEGRERPTRLPALVWSSFNARAARDLGLPNVTAIGAPFAYLDQQMGSRWSGHAGTGTIVYPLHAGAGVQVDRSGEQRFVDELREREAGPVTVCLYWREHEVPEIRRRYEDAGFRVITHGSRDDPQFLHRQREELLRHRRAVTNRVSTAIFYAGLLGLEISIYGPIFAAGGSAEVRRWETLHQERWPALVREGLDGAAAHEVSAAELGVDQMRDAGELADLLGWAGPKRIVASGAEALVTARRRLTSRSGARPR
jgi:hypothetical protein